MILDQMATLADATRARLLALLERHELAVSELCQVVQLPQSTVSRHLKVLADEGWVASRTDGPSRRYRMLDVAGGAERRLWELVREQVGGGEVARHDTERLQAVLAERRQRSQAFFAGAASRWDAMRAELFGRGLDAVALGALADAAWVVGDLGCGTGRLAAALAPHVARVVGIDGSREMLDAARVVAADHANVELRLGELEALPLDDGTLDVALCALVLHHVAAPGRVVAEAARVLRPGGRLVVVDMVAHGREEYRLAMGHQWLGFEAAQVLAWFAAAGLAAGRVTRLAADPDARGPGMFTASARRPT